MKLWEAITPPGVVSELIQLHFSSGNHPSFFLLFLLSRVINVSLAIGLSTAAAAAILHLFISITILFSIGPLYQLFFINTNIFRYSLKELTNSRAKLLRCDAIASIYVFVLPSQTILPIVFFITKKASFHHRLLDLELGVEVELHPAINPSFHTTNTFL